MKFTIAKEDFSHLLYLTSTIVERRNTMPILANVKLTAEDKELKVAATDLEISLTGSAAADVSNPGTTTIAARVLYDIVKELPHQKIEAKLTEGQRLEIESGQSRYKINGVSAEEFPTIAGIDLKKPAAIEASKIQEMIDKTAFAISNDETRHNINGLYAETVTLGGKSCLRFVATDGHRLALIDKPADGFNLKSGVIIPKKGIQELRKVLEGNEGAAQVSYGEGFFTVKSQSVTIGIRLVDGQFPDYRQVIPSESKTTVEVSREELLATAKRVSLVTTDKSKAIKFKVVDNTLVLSSSSPEYGEAMESIAIAQTGENVTIGFSARYVIDALSAMGQSEMASIRLNGELGPGVFSGDKDESYSCIIMPMRFD